MDGPEAPAPARPVTPRVVLVVGGVVIGVVVVLVVVAISAWGGDSDGGEPATTSFPAVDHDPDAAEALVVAWERWRTATFVSTGVWSRTLDAGGSPLEGPVFTAQDPPRRRTLRLGSIVEQIEGTVARCDLPSEDLIVPDCLAADTTRSYEERVADEMELVRRYVAGPNRLYDVGFGDPECFQVELETAALRSPWGRWSEFCFDDATGALRSSRTRRASAVDTEIITGIRSEVTDADFS